MVKNKTKRIFLLIGGCLFFFVWFVFYSMQRNISYFYEPSELVNIHQILGKKIRIGGIVVPDTILYNSQYLVFDLKDTKKDQKKVIKVFYTYGIVPDLFRENQGIVAEGFFKSKDGMFIADKLITKHDETYMPQEKNSSSNQ